MKQKSTLKPKGVKNPIKTPQAVKNPIKTPQAVKNPIKTPQAVKNPIKTQKKRNLFHIKKTLKQYPNNLRMYSIDKVNIFDNKNILCLTSEGYTIYDNKFKIIKRKKNLSVTAPKIIDDKNFICLIDRKKLIKINIETGKHNQLFEFPYYIKSIKYFKNNNIITIIYDEGFTFKIWQKLNDGSYQLMTKLSLLSFSTDKNIEMYLTKNENCLITTNPFYGVTFWDLPKFRYDHELDYYWHEEHFCQVSENEIVLGKGRQEGGDELSNEIVKYNIKDKKIVLIKKFNFKYGAIDYLDNKNIFLINGSRPKSKILNNIYVLNNNFAQMQAIEIPLGHTIEFFSLYQKDDKEEYLFYYFYDDDRPGYGIEILSFV